MGEIDDGLIAKIREPREDHKIDENHGKYQISLKANDGTPGVFTMDNTSKEFLFHNINDENAKFHCRKENQLEIKHLEIGETKPPYNFYINNMEEWFGQIFHEEKVFYDNCGQKYETQKFNEKSVKMKINGTDGFRIELNETKNSLQFLWDGKKYDLVLEEESHRLYYKYFWRFLDDGKTIQWFNEIVNQYKLVNAPNAVYPYITRKEMPKEEDWKRKFEVL